ncbi:MAG: DUF4422 domain-containing protein [Roseburia sp.]
MKLQIFAMTHKKFDVPRDSLYRPLHVGRAVSENLGYPGDDTGENISALNCYYSELTGFYWIWKNYHEADYVGTCHYRRYLINESGQVFTAQEYEKLLGQYDLITTRRVRLNNSYHFGFAANHNIKALDMTGEVIRELYPEYHPMFLTLVHGNETYFGNMLVTSKKLFDFYAQWLFTIFFEVARRIELETGEDAYHKRVFGFISEFLLLVWVKVNRLKVLECKVGMLGEKAETREMKECLAGYFSRKDIVGARDYFMTRYQERPDVLMEASDVTGELRLSMQVIATAEQELRRYGYSVLDTEHEFNGLIALFTGINHVVWNYRNGIQTPEDIHFLKEHKVTETAVEIAVMILRESRERIATLQRQIITDLQAE